MGNQLRYLPSVHHLKEHERFFQILNENLISEGILTEWVNEQVNIVRNKIIKNEINLTVINREGLVDYIFQLLNARVDEFSKNQLRQVINATGVVLHTNLGRSRLCQQAIDQIAETAGSYSTLEYNLKAGERGSRHEIVEDYINTLTGAEAAVVVNNNAGAVFLVLKAIASGKEVIISRGELVEIGGSFRISEIMKESQAILIDVGTTNKTHIVDYEQAISENTALLLKVHKSNFKISGFTKEVDTGELVNVSRKHQIPIYEDLGSGTMFNFQERHIGSEPTVQEKVQAGIDIISFSGDKLLGGPQAGIIVGKKSYVEKIKKHQLARVLRVDKFTLAGLEATLKTYIRNQEQQEIPAIRDILASSETVLEKATHFIREIESNGTKFSCRIEQDTSKVGGGTMPDVELDTFVVSLEHEFYSSSEITMKLRSTPTPVIARLKNETVILDFRAVTWEELEMVIEAFLQIQ